MDKKSLLLLSFTTREALEKLRWEKPWEFEYNGHMYDVVSSEIRGDTLFYHCFWDKLETSINIQIKELIAKNLGQNPQNRENQKRLITFLQTLYLPDHFLWDPYDRNHDKEFYPDDRFSCLSVFPEPEVPPPRIS